MTADTADTGITDGDIAPIASYTNTPIQILSYTNTTIPISSYTNTDILIISYITIILKLSYTNNTKPGSYIFPTYYP